MSQEGNLALEEFTFTALQFQVVLTQALKNCLLGVDKTILLARNGQFCGNKNPAVRSLYTTEDSPTGLSVS